MMGERRTGDAKGVCRVCGVRHYGQCYRCPHDQRVAGAWEDSPCADCVLSDADVAVGHGRGVSFDSPPRGVERAAAEMLDALRHGAEFAVSDEVRARFVAFVHGVADMGPGEFAAFQSWLRGETASDAARRSGVTRQATAKARRKMLRKLRVAE